jgi:CheY-like chemotaxis protein
MGNKTILVVDDERDMRIFISTVVETLGFEAIPTRRRSSSLMS